MTAAAPLVVEFEEFWAIARPIPTTGGDRISRGCGDHPDAHVVDDDDDGGSHFSLRQVASVYANVWQALASTKKQHNLQPVTSSTDEAFLLAKIIHEIMKSRSQEIKEKDQDKSMSTTNTSSISPFLEFNKIVLPLLPSQPSQDFVDAVLDLFFPVSSSKTMDRNVALSWDNQGLEEFLEFIMQNATINQYDDDKQRTTTTSSFQMIVCRVLRRLQEFQPDNSIIWKAIAQQIVQGLLSNKNSPIHTVADVGGIHDDDEHEQNNKLCRRRVITDLLLPIFTSSSSSTSDPRTSTDTMPSGKKVALDLIWTSLWDNDQSSSGPLSSLTTVACAILPECVGMLMPLIACKSDNHSNLQPLPPSQQKPVWNLIQRCLAQGITEFDDEKRQYDSLYRRRGLYLLRTLLDHQNLPKQQEKVPDAFFWNNYVAVFELFEMESEQHLIDQAWDTMIELLEYSGNDASVRGSLDDWKRLLLARTLVSPDVPILRKHGLSRFLQDQTGIRIAASQKMITVNFLFSIVIPSMNSLVTSLGTNIVLRSKNKIKETQDMLVLLSGLLSSYLKHCIETKNEQQIREYVISLWSMDVMVELHRKLAVQIYQAVETVLKSLEQNNCLPVSDDMLRTLTESYRLAVANGTMAPYYRGIILKALATILHYSKPSGNIAPITFLKVLAMFPVKLLDETRRESTFSDHVAEIDTTDNAKLWWIEQDTSLVSLGRWLLNCGNTENAASISIVGASLAKAFVDGTVMGNNSCDDTPWDPKRGLTSTELDMAKAIGLLCVLPSYVLSCENALETQSNRATEASELLWPAIHKGLSFTPLAMSSADGTKASNVSRALLLLEIGVKLQVLSGVGNGELVIDKFTKQMLPPPANIEALLSNAASFIVFHCHALFSPHGSKMYLEDKGSGGASRSGAVKLLCSTFVQLTEQIHVLSKGFLSSLAISAVVDSTFQKCIKVMFESKNVSQSRYVENLAILFLALSGGANVNDDTRWFTLARTILDLSYEELESNRDITQATRSIFYFAKWSSLSSLLHQLKNSPSNDAHVKSLLDDIFFAAAAAVESSPQNTILPLFRCLLKASKSRFSDFRFNDTIFDDITFLDSVISALFSLLENAENGIDFMHMLDDICRFIFCPSFLLDEHQRLEENEDCKTPIRDAFRRLMKMAGTRRPHISRIAISRICAGWSMTHDKHLIGLSAIPYRSDIVNVLLHKEEPVPPSGQSFEFKHKPLECETDETSVARGMLLVFLSKFPDVEDGLSIKVLKNLLHFVIKQLSDIIRPSGPGFIVFGSPEYCRRMRALQALCVLSRFITADVTETVCQSLFDAMGKQNSHHQPRYFMEILTLQVARKHPKIFAQGWVEQINRCDLSLSTISSLMIISGNLIVGRYQSDFYQKLGGDSDITFDLRAILSGAIPWLSSTQGFSRAIAQLLVHKLIPMIIDVNVDVPVQDSNWVLRSIYRFLEEHQDMKRLRNKQLQFFEQYEADTVCTPEGVLSIPVDTSDEANPRHLIDVIKDCLEELYEEGHIDDAPLWKQMESLEIRNDKVSPCSSSPSSTVNFQRKIIPIDALNLEMEEIRERRFRNTMGRKKQDLIVCASLIDKIPNLGGLARTSEIFAADRLVIPDVSITKMDNFQTICVGAQDWLTIEECKEENLCHWLRSKKDRGYWIVGLEQTSSSVSLSEYTYPDQPTILLLGKEKEGIPVEFLQLVDQCVEIPQLGVIRSLNVHVSGAIAIWERTKQMNAKIKTLK